MTPRAAGRTAPCTRLDATTRLRQAEKFLEVAHLVSTESEAIPAFGSVSAALAVLAGIAASDASCCATQGARSRGQNHKQAVDMIRQS